MERDRSERAAGYAELAGPSVERHGGRFLARGGAVSVLEDEWSPERLVVIEFDSVDAARAWYASEDYRAARSLRQGAGFWRIVVVEGVPVPAGTGRAALTRAVTPTRTDSLARGQ